MITIFTPTYNRAHTISRTYQSLTRQTCKDFEWLVVDDGSTDSTKLLISSWLNKSDFVIRYIQKPNAGKYKAYNWGLREAKGNLFFCVDSDDWLPDNAVELIKQEEKSILGTENIAGMIALKIYENGHVIGKPYAVNTVSSLYKLSCEGYGGERSLVFDTRIAQKYPFPEKTNEKFMGESVIYDRFEEKYQFLVRNYCLTVCEYQADGLSSSPRSLMLANPTGYKLYFSQRVDIVKSLRERIPLILRYHAFNRLSKNKEFIYQGKHKLLVKLLTPFSIGVYLYYKYCCK